MENVSRKPTAYSYVRMSSRQQLTGDSLRRQLALSRAYAAENDLVLDETLRDIGISAWTGENIREGALGRFCQLVQTGHIERGSYLLVESFDRLSRQQVRKSIGPFIDLINAGITVVTLGDRQVYSDQSVDDNFSQLIVSLVIMSSAHEESETRSRRLKEAYENRRKNARAGKGRFSAKIWGWLDQIRIGPDQYEYIPNVHADTVRKIFELADMGFGHVLIMRRLNMAQTPGFRGRPAGWQQATISSILKNEAVIGTYQPIRTVDGKREPYGEPIPHYLPSIITDEVFWRVQRNRRQRASKANNSRRLTNILGPLAVCAWCGSTMMVKTGAFRKTWRKYLRCDTKYRGGECLTSRRSFRYDIAEKAILDNYEMFQRTPKVLDDGASLGLAELNAAISEKETFLHELMGRRGRLMALAEAVESDEDRLDFLSEIKARRFEIEGIKGQISELRNELVLFGTGLRKTRDAGELLQMERSLWLTGSDQEVRESRSKVSIALTRVVERISFDPNEHQFTINILGGLRSYIFEGTGVLVKEIYHG